MRPKSGFLSETLREFLADLDQEYIEDVVAPKEREQHEALRIEFDRLIKSILRSVESISVVGPNLRAAGFDTESQAFRDLLEFYIDEKYTQDLVERVPKMVARTMRLNALGPVHTLPIPATNLYISEATRTYVFGFWHASIAFSRAALEAALRERIEGELGQSRTKLRYLITTGRRLGFLDGLHEAMADRVAEAGNRVLHEEPADEKVAWSVLREGRSVLIHLYTAQAH